jgi:8-oxo-dGTP pyrophosphatase MutT (NUDIX family)
VSYEAAVLLHRNGFRIVGEIEGRTASLVVERDGVRLGTVDVVRDLADGGRATVTCGVDEPNRRQGVAAVALAAGVRRLEAFVAPDDLAALHLAVAAGWRAEGVARAVLGPDGTPSDLVQVAILAGDPREPETARVAALRSALPRRALAAGLVLRNASGQALVVQTSYKTQWEVVGGVVERGEPLATAARREVLEELGVALRVGDLVVVDACTSPEMLAVLFDGGVLPDDAIDAFTFPDGEIVRAVWADRPTILARCGARVGARLVAALDAYDDGRLPGPPLVLRDGRPDV